MTFTQQVRRLARLRSLAKWIHVAAIALSVAVFFLPDYGHLLTGSLIALPWVVVCLKVDPALRRKRGTAFVLGLFTCTYGYGAGFEINVLADASTPSIHPTKVVGMSMSRGGSAAIRILTLASWGPVRKNQDINVSAAWYQAIHVGDTLCVYLSAGAFRVPWYQVGDCPENYRPALTSSPRGASSNFQNSPGLRIGIPRNACSARRSLSPVIMTSARPANAVPSIGKSFGSRQASPGISSGVTNSAAIMAASRISAISPSGYLNLSRNLRDSSSSMKLEITHS